MWKCSRCGQGIGLSSKHVVLRRGESRLYIQESPLRSLPWVVVPPFVGRVAPGPGHYCMGCAREMQKEWEEAEARELEEKQRLERQQDEFAERREAHPTRLDRFRAKQADEAQEQASRAEEARQRAAEEAALAALCRDPNWALHDLPISATCPPEAQLLTLAEAAGLGCGESHHGVRRYRPGDTSVGFFGTSLGIEHEWDVIRIGQDSWAIVEHRWRWTD